MATTTIKSTYALDVETVHTLAEMARRWGVSKSEALRRAIRTAANQESPVVSDAIQALDELQRSLKLSPKRAGGWVRSVQAERRASWVRGEARTK